MLVSSSGVGYYGAHGDEPIDEEAPAGSDFLAQVCVAWEAEARAAERLGVRVVRLRTGVVLDPGGGALGKMLPPFKLGVGGPVAGGQQYISWIHVDDLVGIAIAAIDGTQWRGAVNATAPEPQRNRDFSKALGKALRRPSLLPVPGAALQLAVRRDGCDRDHRRARASRAGAHARIRVPLPAARRRRYAPRSPEPRQAGAWNARQIDGRAVDDRGRSRSPRASFPRSGRIE